MPARRGDPRSLPPCDHGENAAEAAGGFQSLTEAEAFAIEYWPLERYKLAQPPAPES